MLAEYAEHNVFTVTAHGLKPGAAYEDLRVFRANKLKRKESRERPPKDDDKVGVSLVYGEVFRRREGFRTCDWLGISPVVPVSFSSLYRRERLSPYLVNRFVANRSLAGRKLGPRRAWVIVSFFFLGVWFLVVLFVCLGFVWFC